MAEHEARVRAFYDHEAEESRAGRRRRQVADWGVGEDVFDRLPSRRFSRAESAHVRWTAEPAGPASEAAPGADAPARAPRPDFDAVTRPPRPAADATADAGRSKFAGSARPEPAEFAGSRRRAPAEVDGRRPRPAPRNIPRGGVDDGRRTIVIGEPRDDYESAAPRRPPRLAHQRVGPRPDRIVAYAVGLGVLLILIAILSAGH